MTPLPGNYLICAHAKRPSVLTEFFLTLLNYLVGEVSLFSHLDNLTILSPMPDN